ELFSECGGQRSPAVRTAGGGCPPPQTVSILQTRLAENRRASCPTTDVRDLRLLPADGRCSSARGESRARRNSLVRSPRRLPHRNPRADESAERQECGHRADGIEGRLRGEESFPRSR